jgi:hypothetical protein
VAPESPVAIGPDDRLLRRVLNLPDYLEWHDDFRQWVPSLAGIRFDSDGMSVFLRRLLEARSHSAIDVQTLGGTNDNPAVVYQFEAAAATDAGFRSEHSPNEDTPIGYAHASILKPDELPRMEERKARARLAASMILIHGRIELTRPDGA